MDSFADLLLVHQLPVGPRPFGATERRLGYQIVGTREVVPGACPGQDLYPGFRALQKSQLAEVYLRPGTWLHTVSISEFAVIADRSLLIGCCCFIEGAEVTKPDLLALYLDLGLPTPTAPHPVHTLNTTDVVA